jgi:hypothetical protein
MKRQQRREPLPVEPQRDPIEPTPASEPVGHVHPNYRHWAWFRPNNW